MIFKKDPNIPSKPFHLWQIGLLLLVAGMIGWSAFIKPTTHIADGGTQINNYEVPKVPLAGFSCMRLNMQMFWQTKTPMPQQKATKK